MLIMAGVLWTKGDDVVEKLKEKRSYEEVDQADSENEDTLIWSNSLKKNTAFPCPSGTHRHKHTVHVLNEMEQNLITTFQFCTLSICL